jgi:hypothetical protein
MWPSQRGLAEKPILLTDLSSCFWEFTAQCATYAYLKANADSYERFGYSEFNANSYAKWGHLKAKDDQILKAFEHLSEHQPFIYRTWKSLGGTSEVFVDDYVQAN